jgi:hypothetical protein
MKTIKITIRCDTPAFKDDPGAEVARILRELAQDIDVWLTSNGGDIGIHDVTGNRVGKFEVKEG